MTAILYPDKDLTNSELVVKFSWKLSPHEGVRLGLTNSGFRFACGIIDIKLLELKDLPCSLGRCIADMLDEELCEIEMTVGGCQM